MKTTTTNKKKLEHKAIIEKWQTDTAMKIAVSTLKNIYQSTFDPKVEEMYHGIIRDQKAIKNPVLHDYTVSDGFDCFGEAFAYIKEMNKEGYWLLYQPDTITITFSKGKKKKASLFQGGCYAVRHYIYKHGQVDFKTCYIEDFSGEDTEGNELNCYDALDGLIKVNRQYDIDNYSDYITMMELVKELNDILTTGQKDVFHMRLKGMSVSDIAVKLGVSQQAVSKRRLAIQEVIKTLHPEMVRGFKEKRERKATKSA